ncbi:MAG TPA: hypothetical protein VKU39_10390 [Streptosporangiaceae bacterium]|nr:hypothetical protein [Streptosporangiaceae bacterium]
MTGITPDDAPEGQDDGHGSCCSAGTLYRDRQLLPVLEPGPVPLAKLISVAVTRW